MLTKLPDAQYYRWKSYSLRNGDTPYSWRTEPFQIFLDGEYWIPPDPIKDQDDEIRSNPDEEEARLANRVKGYLGQSGQKKLLWLLRRMDSRRGTIARAMAFAIDRADAAEEVCFPFNKINIDCRRDCREFMFRRYTPSQKDFETAFTK